MFLGRILLVAAAAFLSLVQSWPVTRNVKSLSNPQAEVTIHDVSKYTTEYFLESVDHTGLRCNSCLFYTRGLTETAQRYATASTSGLVTIWDIWPSEFYNGDVGDPRNPLRGIFNDPVTIREYFENMSSAMAQLCSGYATVMTNNTNDIPMNGIWGKSELPTLQSDGNPGGQVHTVIAIDAKGDNSQTCWVHPRPDSKNCEPRLVPKMKTQTVAKRSGLTHYTPVQLQTWFAGVPF